MGQSRMRVANWWYSRKEYSIAVKCYKKALMFYNDTNQVEKERTYWLSDQGLLLLELLPQLKTETFF